jgi:hypothetical protein
MLRGSIIHGYDYDGGNFSDLCLRRMDGDQGPWESELQVVAMVLLRVAWLTLVLGCAGGRRLRPSRHFRVCSPLPSPEP